MHNFTEGLLTGKRILITGGGTGLGKSMGRRFLSLGANIVICGRRTEVLDATAAEFKTEFGREVESVGCDIRVPADVERMLDKIWDTAPLDGLVNNAAGNFIAQTHKLSARAIDSILGICLHGTLSGAPFTVPSAMAKAGIEAMTKSLAVEWGPKGIRLVAVAPGSFPTEGAGARLTPQGGGNDSIQSVPLRRDGDHIELANLCAFLMSDLAGYITGETVVIDGGRRYLGGSRSGGAQMLDWSDEDWQRQRAAMPK